MMNYILNGAYHCSSEYHREKPILPGFVFSKWECLLSVCTGQNTLSDLCIPPPRDLIWLTTVTITAAFSVALTLALHCATYNRWHTLLFLSVTCLLRSGVRSGIYLIEPNMYRHSVTISIFCLLHLYCIELSHKKTSVRQKQHNISHLW